MGDEVPERITGWETRPGTRQTRDRTRLETRLDKTGDKLLREEERKENSGIGGMDVYLYVPNIKSPTRQMHANK